MLESELLIYRVDRMRTSAGFGPWEPGVDDFALKPTEIESIIYRPAAQELYNGPKAPSMCFVCFIPQSG